MRLLNKTISTKDGEGIVKVLVEEPEDLYHCYNLISKGDLLRSSTLRKIVNESNSGSVQSTKVKITLTIEVENVEYDPADLSIRVKGKNRSENPHIKLGAYHTLEIEPGRDFTLRKARWDSIFLDILEEATDVSKRAQVGAVVMQMGSALICLVTNHMTIVRTKIEQNVPKKRAGDAANHDKAAEKFYASVLDAVAKQIDFSVVKCLVIASPGFIKDDFMAFVDTALASSTSPQAANHQLFAGLRNNRNKILLAKSSSGHKQALLEVLARPEIQSQMKDTKSFEEVKALAKFFELINTPDPDTGGERAVYGYAHVRLALEANAVEDLLISDELFRNAEPKTRRKYVILVENAQAGGSRVLVFSRAHESGEQLQSMTGIAATLRFPMVIPDDDDDEQLQQQDLASVNDTNNTDDDNNSETIAAAAQALAALQDD
jgi:protein pelota